MSLQEMNGHIKKEIPETISVKIECADDDDNVSDDFDNSDIVKKEPNWPSSVNEAAVQDIVKIEPVSKATVGLNERKCAVILPGSSRASLHNIKATVQAGDEHLVKDKLIGLEMQSHRAYVAGEKEELSVQLDVIRPHKKTTVQDIVKKEPVSMSTVQAGDEHLVKDDLIGLELRSHGAYVSSEQEESSVQLDVIKPPKKAAVQDIVKKEPVEEAMVAGDEHLVKDELIGLEMQSHGAYMAGEQEELSLQMDVSKSLDNAAGEADSTSVPSARAPRDRGGKVFTCEICSKPFTRHQNLEKHMFIHTGEKPFACEVCHKQFSRITHLNEHKRVHTGEKPYTCEVCLKQFPSTTNLNRHKSVHTQIKPFSCPICYKQFADKSNLNSHIRVHTGEKPFSCNVCQKQFGHKSHLNVHKRLHTGEKRYTCEICHKHFGHRNNLNSHILIHTGEKPFSCDICDKKFNKKSTLVRHKRLVHK